MSRARDIAGRYLGALKADTIAHPSASVTAITLDSAGSMTGSFPAPNRNLLYNGAMQVSQRGTSTASITTSGYYTADRWAFGPDSMGTFTMTVENDAPTGSGLSRSVKVLCTTADAAPAAGDSIGMTQSLEGQDLQRIRKGTSSAQKLTLSFWVKANVTGTYVAELIDSDNGRRVSGSYSVTASATWEKKTVTFPADTTGALDNDNAVSLVLRFWLGAGSTFTGGSPLQTTWGTASNTRATGQTNLAAATNNYWQVTGVQLETGDVATDFEFKSYGQELAECQRYYWRSKPGTGYGAYGMGHCADTTSATIIVTLPTTLRSTPTTIEYSSLRLGDTASSLAVTALGISYASPDTQFLTATIASGGVQYRPVHLGNNANASGYLAFGAEL